MRPLDMRRAHAASAPGECMGVLYNPGQRRRSPQSSDWGARCMHRRTPSRLPARGTMHSRSL
eukprot:8851598-Alexandrium_andersonii.AAC.1